MELIEPSPSVLQAFGLDPKEYQHQRTGSGHINQTYLITGKKNFILQRINTYVFRRPERIAKNIRLAADHLKICHPDYLFLSPIRTQDQKEMFTDESGFPWRLFPYIDGSITLNELKQEEEAREAAAGFGKLTANLNGISMNGFEPTIPDFHNLSWRYEQFQQALQQSTEITRETAKHTIEKASHYQFLVEEYQQLISRGHLTERIVHNDTKINNILFSSKTGKALCVIDLDTLMQGYFIYDLGDLVRTCVSPVSEEEPDFSKIVFRKNFYDAVVEGYLSEMNPFLSAGEKEAIPFAGMMVTYIMALRFLADFLNGNVYYQIHYPLQNLVRATNQLKLVEEIEKNLRPF